MIAAFSFVACVATVWASRLVAQGTLKPVYVLGIVSGLYYAVVNAALAAHDAGILFPVIPSVWGAVTSAIGLRRLHARPVDPDARD